MDQEMEPPQQQPEGGQKKEEPKKLHLTTKQLFNESVEDTARVLNNAEYSFDTPRAKVDSALLGTCVVFFATMLALSQFDISLTIALVIFSLAMPLLACSIIYSWYKVRPVPGYLILEAIRVGAWVAGAVGELATVIGIFFVILHLSRIATITFVAAVVFAIALVPLFSFVGLIIYAVWKYRKEQKVNALEPKKDEGQ